MKNRFIEALVAGVLLSATGLASAEPLALTEGQMDTVSAAGVLDPLVGNVVTLVNGVVGTVTGVVTTVDALLPAVNLQAGATATIGAGLAISL
jgi:hypothetical protein